MAPAAGERALPMTPSTPPVTLGLVGCGRATQQLHLPALQAVPGIRVVAVADTDRNRLDATAARFGIARRHTEPEAVLADPAIEAVAICVPVAAHAELAVAALESGRHVLVEKPLAVSLAEAERMVAAAARSGRVAAVGFNFRCHRLVARARELVASGALGRIQQVITTWGSGMQHEPGLPEWRRRRATGGGALFEIGIHHLDACAFLLGEPIEDVQMLAQTRGCEDESVSLLARTRSGVMITSAFSQVTTPVNEVRIVGDEGQLAFSMYRADSFEFVRRSDPHYGWRARWRRLARWRELPTVVRVGRGGGDYLLSYREEWRRFARAVREGSPPASGFAEGLAALQVMYAAFAAAESGRLTRVTPS